MASKTPTAKALTGAELGGSAAGLRGIAKVRGIKAPPRIRTIDMVVSKKVSLAVL